MLCPIVASAQSLSFHDNSGPQVAATITGAYDGDTLAVVADL
ncbi:MAG: hypothetical protein OXG98_14110 [Gemmatimonadetes bacterium]|nr:hypothetical protein [Gemmatimonadota bacterium]